MEQTSKLDRLRGHLGRLPGAAVAFSGGVDSGFLAFVAGEALGRRAVAVTADSPSLPRRELQAARAFARRFGLRHDVVATTELLDRRYARNDGRRCAFCKEALLEALTGLRLPSSWKVLLGVNVDDLGDHRPGQAAARARGAMFPLVEAGLAKSEVRALSRELGLPLWDKPAAACLASRIAYGVPVTEDALSRVERAEEALRALGFHGDVRVRDQGRGMARIEVAPEELPRVMVRREEVLRHVKAAGFMYVTVDLEGYRRGSHNQLLELEGP